MLNACSKTVRRYARRQKFIFINRRLLCTKFAVYLVCNVLYLSSAKLSHAMKRSVCHADPHTHAIVRLNQSLLISLITTFVRRAREFRRSRSILALIIINALNALMVIGSATLGTRVSPPPARRKIQSTLSDLSKIQRCRSGVKQIWREIRARSIRRRVKPFAESGWNDPYLNSDREAEKFETVLKVCNLILLLRNILKNPRLSTSTKWNLQNHLL